MSDDIDKIKKKAFKLANAVNNPTGNEHYDEVARTTFKRFCETHNIDEKTINSLTPVKHEHLNDNRYESELFLMLAIKVAEDKKMLNDINVRLDIIKGFIYSGPGFFYDEIYPTYCKLLRKYQITRDDVKSKVERTYKTGGSYQIVSLSGSVITVMGNILTSNVKYSEQAFYNAFIHKYDLMAQCVLKKIQGEQPQQQRELTKEEIETQNSIREMFAMFHKESMNDQIDKS